MEQGSTAIVVTYGVNEIDLDWIPSERPVVIVHNDDRLSRSAVDHPRAVHLDPGRNIGFGAGVNLALAHVDSRRVVLHNPDMALTRAHWLALESGPPDEVLTLPQVDTAGVATSVVNRYPTALAMLSTGLRLGRLLPRGSRRRRMLAPLLLGRWGEAHEALQLHTSGAWPMQSHWVSGAVLSVDTERLRAVGGFDVGYFLYMEDVDLCARLGQRFPEMRIRLATTSPAVHRVGGTAGAAAGQRTAEVHRLASARRYVAHQRGLAWRATGAALRLRSMAVAQ